jgi:hypothetical protein
MIRLRILAVMMLCTVGLFACGTAQKANKTAGDDTVADTVIITGMVKIYGSEPHTYAGIESGDGKIYAVYPRE